MKKVISTVTALAFVLGLAGAGLAQTAGKEVKKSAVGTETPASQTQAVPAEKEKPGAEKAVKMETKKAKQAKECAKKPATVKKGKKAVDMPEKPAVPPVEQPKPAVK